MLRAIVILTSIAALAARSGVPVAAAQRPPLSLTLTGVPSGPDAVRAGQQISYLITHAMHGPPAGLAYEFITPTGTTFVSARAISGARLATQLGYTSPPGTSPAGQPGVRVLVTPAAPAGSVEVDVRVNYIWQGTVSAQASVIGAGLGSSDVVTASVALPDGVPGVLAASKFVDLNGNARMDIDDVGERCPVYVYADLTGKTVPDDLASPTDPRLPLVAFDQTDPTGTAAIVLLPGRYAVYFGACDVPPPPSGAPQTAFDVIEQPPATQIKTASGRTSYSVQIVDVVGNRQTDAVVAERPVGASAPPTDLRLDDRTLRWTDNAEGETGYTVSVTSEADSGTFDLPPQSSSFTVPASFIVPCGTTHLQVSVAAVSRGNAGYPARFDSVIAADCAPPRPIRAPAAGYGAPDAGGPSSWWRSALPMAISGWAIAAAGVGVRRISKDPRKARRR